MEHLTTMTLRLALEEGGALPCRTEALGPLLQGFLMETIDSEFASFLHASAFNPYSQCCVADGEGSLIWRISALNNEASERLLAPLSSIERVRIKAINRDFSVQGVSTESVPLESVLSLISSDTGLKHKVRFLTPTSFKCQGEYVNIPTVRLIFQNLLMHYNQVNAGNNEIDGETVAYLAEHVRISSYNLRSQYYPQSRSGRAAIPSFVGEVTLSVSGPQPLRGLVSMLLEYGTYSGVGIKTSMGMGGICRVRPK